MSSNENEQGVKTDFVSLFLMLATIVVCLGAYHFFIAKPGIEAGKVYYVVDLPALTDAKAVSILRAYHEQGIPLDEDVILVEVASFRERLVASLLDASAGYPVFQKGSVIRAGVGVQDITPALAQYYELNLNDSFEEYLKSLSAQPKNNQYP